MQNCPLPAHILRSVQKPARYLGGEQYEIIKWDPRRDAAADRPLIRFAFCFPDLYEIGMSNLALRIIYDLINQRDDAFCERVFAPAADLRDILIAENLPLFTLETASPLKDFDILGFTLQYELSYLTVLDVLKLSGIPLLAAERSAEDPLVICGGPIICNVEPLADFIDIMQVGEGEELMQNFLDCYADCKRQGLSKAETIARLAELDGIYVPAFYQPIYNQDMSVKEFIDLTESKPVQKKVRRQIVKDLNSLDFPTSTLVPNLEIVHDRAFIELFRGCPRGCRFCQAGQVYKPMREKEQSKLLSESLDLLEKSGYDELGLLSLSTGDYSELADLADDLLDNFAGRDFKLSLPSLRLDSFSFALMQRAQSRGQRSGLTFAPEAGSQRLRDIINKNISEEDLLKASEYAFRGGWSHLKFYFMLGLPGERDEDIIAIADLVKKVLSIYDSLGKKERARRMNIVVSTSFFIPKAWTPFQWAAQIPLAEMRRRQELLAKELRISRVKYQWHDPAATWVEGILARGDRRLSQVLLNLLEKGSWLDAWSENLSLEKWQEAMVEADLDPDFYLGDQEGREGSFAWEILDMGVNPEHLWSEWQKAKAEITLAECREACAFCGAQEYCAGICPSSEERQKIKLGLNEELEAKDKSPAEFFAEQELEGVNAPAAATELELKPFTYRAKYARSGALTWLGHLDMMRLFERSFRRAGLALARSGKGYRPKPDLVFALPVGLGVEVEADVISFALPEDLDPAEIEARFKATAHPQLKLYAVERSEVASKKLMGSVSGAKYRIECPGIAAAATKYFASPGPHIHIRMHKEKPRPLDLDRLVLAWTALGADLIELKVKAGSSENLRPDSFLAALREAALIESIDEDDAIIIRCGLYFDGQEMD
ncbi:MAG: TIGR03960 family B12-binding radical SAM protein [Eubacteriales bacterium]|nr:TIGR03960 family B12-binding radical SAM protein [Eubacteriales bacterium]